MSNVARPGRNILRAMENMPPLPNQDQDIISVRNQDQDIILVRNQNIILVRNQDIIVVRNQDIISVRNQDQDILSVRNEVCETSIYLPCMYIVYGIHCYFDEMLYIV